MRRSGLTLAWMAAAVTLGGLPAAALDVEQVGLLEGLALPECALPDPANGVVYVSNVETDVEAYWEDDGHGFISKVSPTGEMITLRWLEGSEHTPVNSPKGMCILDGHLYFTDNTRLLKYALDGTGPLMEVPLPHTARLNDMATDGTFVYVSDIELGLVYKVGPRGGQTIVKAPPSINGITFSKGRMLCVSWDEHEVYELDPSSAKEPVPFGLAEHFTTLDGIEALDDGTLIVSDFEGNKVCTVSADGKQVQTLIELDTPADIGLDEQRGLLYVPQLMSSELAVFRLKRP